MSAGRSPSLRGARAANVLLAALLASIAGSAGAGAHRYALDPTYRDECGACHVAYPAPLLAAADWARLMRTLDRHFGSDASVDPAAASTISAWLAANAGRERNASDGAAPRISTTPWFVREHRRAATASVAGGSANCAGCHPAAADGRYDEETVRAARR